MKEALLALVSDYEDRAQEQLSLARYATSQRMYDTHTTKATIYMNAAKDIKHVLNEKEL